jgi:hypothetical protein
MPAYMAMDIQQYVESIVHTFCGEREKFAPVFTTKSTATAGKENT